MGAHSGKFATVGSMSTTKGWSVSETSSPAKFVTSNLSGGSGRTKGIFDWTGSVNGLGGDVPHMPGESFTFTGFLAPDNDVSGNGSSISGTALVESIVIDWDFAAAEPLAWTLNFGGHLAATWSTATVTDTTDVNAVTPCGLLVKNGTDTLTDVTTVSMTISNELQTFVNSSTYAAGTCWTGRKAGNIDWTVAITQQASNRGVANAPDMGTNNILSLYTTATEYWYLKWGHVENYSGIAADTDSGAIVERTINYSMNGWNAAQGSIQRPGAGSAWWGTDAP